MRSWSIYLSITLLTFTAFSAPVAASSSVVQVQPGESLSLLAKRHGTSVDRLIQLNQLKSTRITVGQRLRVRPTTSAAPPRPRQAQPSPAKPTIITVKPGDTLSKLAVQHKTTVTQLQRLNQLKTTRIMAGQKLRVAPGSSVVFKQPSVRLVRGKVLGVPVALVNVDLRDPHVLVTPVLPHRGLGRGVPLPSLAKTSGATALINGGYFHPVSFVPAGDLVVQGRYIATGRVPTAITITPDNRAAITPVQAVRFASMRGYETVISSGPHVLRGGQVAREYSSAYRDRSVFRRAERSAIGIRGDRELILMSSQALLTPGEVAKIMQRAGASDAILLDGGSSAGLAWKGKVIYRPARQVAYGIGVYINYKGKRYTR